MALGSLPTPLMFRVWGWPPSPEGSSCQGFRWGRRGQRWGNASRFGSRDLGCLLNRDSGLLSYPVATPGTLLRWPGARGGPGSSYAKQSVSPCCFFVTQILL